MSDSFTDSIRNEGAKNGSILNGSIGYSQADNGNTGSERVASIFDSDFLNVLQRLSIATRVVIPGGASGNRKSRSKGSSVEFSDFREYAPGDDFRRVDWNAFGRFGKLFVKLFMEEREAKVSIFLDTSKSMDWGTPHKGVAARRLAAAIAYIAMCGMDRVSLICINGRELVAKESLRGKNALPSLLQFLDNSIYAGTTMLGEAVKSSNMKGESGVSFVISDMFSGDSLESCVHYLQHKKQEVYLCQILSPEELYPDINGSIRLIDSETGEALDITMVQQLLKAYQKRLQTYQNEIRELSLKRGIKYCGLVSDMPMDKMVLEVISG